MADLMRAAGAAARAADALLRGSGGRMVELRMPAPAVPGDVGEQLGLATPQFQDIELGPVVIRRGKQAGTREMLVSATAVGAVAGAANPGYSAASVLFQVAFGVVMDGVLLEVESVAASEAGGVAYLYRVTLRVPAASIL